jgi:predicted transcriptional regulator
MAGKNVLTVRVSAELQDRLDAIADAMDRPRSWVVNRGLERFVESEAWQIEEIKRGLAEADVGDFASEGRSRGDFREVAPRKSRCGLGGCAPPSGTSISIRTT